MAFRTCIVFFPLWMEFTNELISRFVASHTRNSKVTLEKSVVVTTVALLS